MVNWMQFLNLNADEAQILNELLGVSVSKKPVEQNTIENLNAYTSVRLFLLRTLRYCEQVLGQFFSDLAKQVLAAAGFSYVINLILHLRIIYQAVSAAKNNEERVRFFQEIMARDNRVHEMRNDLVWAVLNITAFFISGGLSVAIIFVAGFAFDLVNELYKTWFDVKTHEHLREKLQNHINSADDKKTNNEIADLYHRLEQKIIAIKINRIRAVTVAVLILVGAVLFFFCPPALPLALGAGLMLLGSLFGGFGRRVCNQADKIIDKFTTDSKPTKTSTDTYLARRLALGSTEQPSPQHDASVADTANDRVFKGGKPGLFNHSPAVASPELVVEHATEVKRSHSS